MIGAADGPIGAVLGRGARPSAGCVLGALLVAVCLLPSVIDLDPARQDLMATFARPSAAHPLGTDHLGRDMLARLAHGARPSPALAAPCVAAAVLGGTALGLLAAAFPGPLHRAVGLPTDAVLALPGLLLIPLLAALAPGAAWALALGIGLTAGVETPRLTRASARAVPTSPAVEASRMPGLGTPYVRRRHAWPALRRPPATLAAFGMATAIVASATLGFIGAGFRPPTPEWGATMAELVPCWREAPRLILQPAALVAATVLGLRLLAGGA